MAIPVSRVILYVKDLAQVAAFYQRHFGMTPLPGDEQGWVELSSGKGGCNIALHKAASRQSGCVTFRLEFPDVFNSEDEQTVKAVGGFLDRTVRHCSAPSPTGASGKSAATATDNLFNIEFNRWSGVEAFLDF